MALLFCDSFDYYNTSQMTRKWSSVGGGVSITSGGRNSTSCAHCLGNNGATINLTSTPATIGVGVAYKPVSAAVASLFLRLLDAGTVQLNFLMLSDGSIQVINGASVTLGTSAPGAVPAPTSTFNYIEVKALISNTVGTVDVRVNGASVLSLTNKDTQNSANAYVTQVDICERAGTGNETSFDDFVVWDTTGSTNNNFMGDTRIEALLPSGAGATTNFAPSAGSNYQCVDDATANDDTDYVSSSNVGDKDTYAMGNLASTIGAVKAVAVNTVDRKDDSGTRTHQHVTRLSGTESTGTAFAPTTTYVNHQSIFETKPGGGAWTISDVNSAEAGLSIAT